MTALTSTATTIPVDDDPSIAKFLRDELRHIPAGPQPSDAWSWHAS